MLRGLRFFHGTMYFFRIMNVDFRLLSVTLDWKACRTMLLLCLKYTLEMFTYPRLVNIIIIIRNLGVSYS